MAKTGYLIRPLLKRVSDDSNEYPLDVNGNRTSLSGLPQATMPNPTNASNYRTLDPTACPFMVTLRTTHDLGSSPHYNEQTIVKVNNVEVYRGAGNYNSTDVREGDIVRFEFNSSPNSLPWAPEGGLNFNIKLEGSQVYNNDITSQASNLGFYEFTVGPNIFDISLVVSPLSNGSVWKIRELHVINNGNIPFINFKINQNPSDRLIANLDIINGSYYIYYNLQDSPDSLVDLTNDNSLPVHMKIYKTSDGTVLYENTLLSGEEILDIPIVVADITYEITPSTAPVAINWVLNRNNSPIVDGNLGININSGTYINFGFEGSGVFPNRAFVGNTLGYHAFHYASSPRWPDDAQLRLRITDDVSGITFFDSIGGNRDVDTVFLDSFILTSTSYTLQVDTYSSDTTLLTPGYELINNVPGLADFLLYIDAIDTTTGFAMLENMPIPSFGQPRNGAYNMKNDSNFQNINFRNTSFEELYIRLQTVGGYDKTFMLSPGEYITMKGLDKSGITITVDSPPNLPRNGVRIAIVDINPFVAEGYNIACKLKVDTAFAADQNLTVAIRSIKLHKVGAGFGNTAYDDIEVVVNVIFLAGVTEADTWFQIYRGPLYDGVSVSSNYQQVQPLIVEGYLMHD